ncbi:MAG TPA: EF-Tu/IF-2/RF-3 family GTPase [Anaerolineae bacterium]|nr:EF-Tu/IF-2/RF-3 family GTPase [Anaerolineae bacterium]HQK15191.1 EF-Tu/IF-2/RF-3 family GTPase [Anaerolineae bacterium]
MRFGNLFLWIGMSLGVNAVLFFVVFSGVVENVIPWIIGLVIVDLLITIPLMASLRTRNQYSGAAYRCRACGHTWSATAVEPEARSPMAEPFDSGLSPFAASAAGFQMTVQDVFSIKGRGTVVTGIVESGVVTKGMTVEIHGASGISRATVDGVEIFRKITDRAVAGDNVGLLLRDVPHDAVQRGDVLRGAR